MIKETFKSLVERARIADILADNLKPLIDAAAKCGLEELFTINQILNRRIKGLPTGGALNSHLIICLHDYSGICE